MVRPYQILFTLQQLCHLVLCLSLVVQDQHQCQRALSHRGYARQAMHPLPRPYSQIPRVYRQRRCVRCIHGCPRPLMMSQIQVTWGMSMMRLMDARKEEDMVIQGETIVASMVGITNRMRLATYVVWENRVTCPRNTAFATSLGAFILLNHPNPQRRFRKGNGLGRARLARRLSQLPHLSHPISRTMNPNRSHYAWPPSDYPLPLSHSHTTCKAI